MPEVDPYVRLTALRRAAGPRSIILSDPRTLSFCPRVLLEKYASSFTQRPIDLGGGLCESLPELTGRAKLAGLVEREFGAGAADLVRWGMLPAASGARAEALPRPEWEEIRKAAESLKARVIFLRQEKLYLLLDPNRQLELVPQAGRAQYLEYLCAETLERHLVVQLPVEGQAALLKETSGWHAFEIEAKGKLWLWRSAQYVGGAGSGEGGEKNFRGYAQVDLGQLPLAFKVIIDFAKQRAREGKNTCFKVLMAVVSMPPDGEKDDPRFRVLSTGRYEEPHPGQSVLVFYGDQAEEMRSLLLELSRRPEWGQIEAERVFKNRREGTNALIDEAGREWRTLGYNFMEGFSEDFVEFGEATGIDWRKMVRGTPTRILSIL